MSREEAIEQLYRLSLDWEENGLDTKLNQTDINAIGTVISELYIANEKLDEIEECVNINSELIYSSEEDSDISYVASERILSIIGGE